MQTNLPDSSSDVDVGLQVAFGRHVELVAAYFAAPVGAEVVHSQDAVAHVLHAHQ